MKTRINWVHDDWALVKNHCRTTVNKEFTEKEPSEKFKKALLISEHSPIRSLEVDWTWEDIYSWVATHWSRHKFEKYISTQRDDRVDGSVFGDFDPVWLDIDGVEHHPYKTRNDKPQGALVRFDGSANAQQLIDAFRKRLCYQASPETRDLAVDFKMTLRETMPELSNVLAPNCVYRCGCPEFKMCKQRYFSTFMDYVGKENPDLYYMLDIQHRYDLYNEQFYKANVGRMKE